VIVCVSNFWRRVDVRINMFIPYALIDAKLIDPLCISDDRVALRNGVYPTGSEPRTARDQQPRDVTTYAMAVLQQIWIAGYEHWLRRHVSAWSDVTAGSHLRQIHSGLHKTCHLGGTHWRRGLLLRNRQTRPHLRWHKWPDGVTSLGGLRTGGRGSRQLSRDYLFARLRRPDSGGLVGFRVHVSRSTGAVNATRVRCQQHRPLSSAIPRHDERTIASLQHRAVLAGHDGIVWVRV